MVKNIILVTSVVLSAMVGTVTAAGDAAAGKAKAGMCVACHGVNGISMIPMYPNLAGQKSAYTVKQLKAFKNKTRVDAVMAGMTAGLTDADMENLAAYYESLK